MAKNDDKTVVLADDQNNAHTVDVTDGETVVESAASDTLKPGSQGGLDGKSKVAYLTRIIGAAHAMKKDDLAQWFDSMMSKMNKQPTSGGSAESNKASISMKKAVSEEFINMFGEDESLTEDFKVRASTLFEAAVEGRVAFEIVRIEEEQEEALAEGLEQIVEELTDQLDQYLTYAVEEFVVENELAIESGLRSEITEDFISGLQKLFVENYIEVPSDKLDVLDTLATKVDELEEALDTTLGQLADKDKLIAEATRREAYGEVVADLSDVQIEKFKKLAESVDFDGDVAAYTTKLTTVKEGFLAANKTAKSGTSLSSLTEETGFESDQSVEKKIHVDPSVSAYASALDRASRK
jgi:hypothetical protein